MIIKFAIDRELLKQIISSHKKFVECSSVNLLSSLHFELIQNTLKVYTTDGTKGLRSIIEVNNISKQNGKFNVDMALIKNITIMTNIMSYILVIVDDNSITFNDEATGTVQKYNLTSGNYPDFENLINSYDYKENNHTVTLDLKFFKQFDVLFYNKKTRAIELHLNKKDNTKPIVAKAKCNNLEQTALLLPVKARS